MTDNSTGNKYFWEKSQFLKRQSVMIELFQQCEEHGDRVLQELDKNDDPFYEPSDTDCLVGVVAVPLVNLSLMEPYTDTLALFNYEAERVGHIEIAFTPCDPSGNSETDYEIEDSIELVGMNLYFTITVTQAMGLPSSFKQTWCCYRFHNHGKPYISPPATGINPKYQFKSLVAIKKANHEFVDYVEKSDLTLEIWGHQKSRETTTSSSRMTSASSRQQGQEVARLRAEVTLLKDCLEDVARIVAGREICEDCDEVFSQIEERIEAVNQ